MMKKITLMAIGYMALVSGLLAVVPVKDNLPGLPGQTDAWWAAKRQEQAAQRAAQGQQQNADANDEAAACFYTGKPFDAELGSYVFKFRNYNPEMQRWTTMDPSGFPDGANNYCYVKDPNSSFDMEGLTTVSVTCTSFTTDSDTYHTGSSSSASVTMTIGFSFKISDYTSGDLVQLSVFLDGKQISLGTYSSNIEGSSNRDLSKDFGQGNHSADGIVLAEWLGLQASDSKSASFKVEE